MFGIHITGIYYECVVVRVLIQKMVCVYCIDAKTQFMFPCFGMQQLLSFNFLVEWLCFFYAPLTAGQNMGRDKSFATIV